MNAELKSISSSLPLSSPPISLNSCNSNLNCSISEIVGTSAKSYQQFTVQDNLIAYLSSGGVVMCEIKEKEVISQRFFSSNINFNFDSERQERDNYGYLINSEPIEIYGPSYTKEPEDNSPSKLKDKVSIRSINCITVSKNKKLLAIGEIGYSPRILIFSLASNSTNNPVVIIHHHSFGINMLEFSPDSKYLTSLGIVNDGFINVWKIGNNVNTTSLHSSNKCSNVINRMVWHEEYIYTFGLRFIKIWKFENHNEGKQQILKGKNVLLGNWINSNFVDCCVLNEEEILLLTSLNQLILLKCNYDAPELIQLDNPIDEDINTIVLDGENEKIYCGLKNHKIKGFKIDELKETTRPTSASNGKLVTSPFKESQQKSIISMKNFLRSSLVYLNDIEEIKFINKEDLVEKVLTTSLLKDINGVKHSYTKEYLIFSKSGSVKELNMECISKVENVVDFKLPNNEVISNTLTAVEEYEEDHVVLGDRHGNLYIVKLTELSYDVIFQIKAHSSTINDITYFKVENIEIIVSISRDRMIQIFTNLKNDWNLLQTIPIHNGNLLKLIHHDSKIYVSSSDKTISVHKFTIQDNQMNVIQEKIITLKSIPIDMKIYDIELVISTMEKNLYIYDTSSFEIKRQFKYYNDVNESISIDTFIKYKNLLIIWSTSDKSFRMYDYFTGKSNGVFYGQQASNLGLFMIDEKIISIGNDGCLFSWCLNAHKEEEKKQVDEEEVKEAVTPILMEAKVARKIIPTQFPSTSPSKSDKIPIQPCSSPPRLSTATLKRIESRNSSPTRTQTQASPSRSPSRANNLNTPTLLPSGKPTLNITTQSPSSRPSSRAGHLNSPTLPPSSRLNNLQSPLKSSPNRTTNISRRPMVLQSPQSRPNTAKSNIFTKLDELKKEIMYLNEDEKMLTKSKLLDIVHLIDDKENYKESEILEKYSDKLVSMFQEKLSMELNNK
ncbi:unnamed protein product [Candida verbasci]|uniref:WD40 repeat-like protein n=1 Tax=Candida verbasci TaxID=1227364 RepID=A0A9W4U1R1_9ASCO|nr:unnamed protein product [Candida verbasci]